MNNFRCVPLLAVILMNLPSANAGEKAPDAKETVVLQRVPVPATDREMGMGIAEFPPNAAKPRHKATGPEVAYVLEGEVTVQVEGELRTREYTEKPAGKKSAPVKKTATEIRVFRVVKLDRAGKSASEEAAA